jgi:ribose transport system ATP-binding protein
MPADLDGPMGHVASRNGQAPPGAGAQPALSLTGVSKHFGGQYALKNVDFELRAGEIHALVGQNGSGKSTLIKILAGYHKAEAGAQATLGGEPFELGDAVAAHAAGLRFVHQDLGLVPALGALDNLALGRGYRVGRTGTISWRREADAGRELLHSLGYDLDLSLPVARLTASERTGIAIARAIDRSSGEAHVLVLDEPTASLPAAEADRLFEVIRAVRDRGVSVVYVSHRFPEVFEIADRITILRDGVRVATRDTAELDEPALIELMIGRALKALEEAHAITHERRADAALRVTGIKGRTLHRLDLEVHAGEIVGIAGVTGSGREEVAQLVFGGLHREGEVTVGGEPVPPEQPYKSIVAGMASVPSDRLSKAALRNMTLRENITVGGLDPFYGRAGLNKRAEYDEAMKWLERLEVVPQDPEALLMTLSGGNQQKVIMARALRLDPRVLVLDEPTQGVDVGAKAAIHAIIEQAARAGTAVLVVSTESEELIGLCDRVLVLVQGRVTGDHPATSLTADELTELTIREDLGSADAA